MSKESRESVQNQLVFEQKIYITIIYYRFLRTLKKFKTCIHNFYNEHNFFSI